MQFELAGTSRDPRSELRAVQRPVDADAKPIHDALSVPSWNKSRVRASETPAEPKPVKGNRDAEGVRSRPDVRGVRISG